MEILSGKQIKALKTVIYGPEGIGKSTFAAAFPEPLFIDTEDSTKFMDVRRFKKPQSWTELLEQVKYVRDTPGLCRTLALDTADWAEKMCVRSVCDKYQKSGIESFDYGKGYTFVYEAFGELLNLLTDVTERGVNVTITAHAATKRREQPDEFGTYDCWGLKLIDSPKCSVANMVKEWADLLLFANYKTLVVAADDKGKKHKAQGGKRVMYTTHHPCWDAKNRQGLPDELPLDFRVVEPYLFPTAPAPASPGPEPKPKPQPLPKPGPKPEPKPDPKPEPEPTSDIPARLAPLLKSADVTEGEVREVIAAKGYFTMDTPWSAMEQAGFLDGWLLPWWDKIVAMIKENPNRLPF